MATGAVFKLIANDGKADPAGGVGDQCFFSEEAGYGAGAG